MQRFGLMAKLITVALGVALAIAALTTADAQQEPPHVFYGHGATAGDTIAVLDSMGAELGSATVDADGSWSIEVDRDSADDVSFTVNGEAAEGEVTNRGDGLDEVSNLTVPEPPAADCPDDSMMGDEDSMESGDESAMLDCPDDSMMGDEDDSMMGDEDGMLDEDTTNGYPETGSGGLADTNGGVSAGLIGLLIALAAASVAGLGLRRMRNRA